MRDLKAYLHAMGHWLNDGKAVDRANELVIPRGKGLPKIGDMLRDLDQEEFLFMNYKNLSRSVHVNDSTVAGYLQLLDGQTELIHDPGDSYSYATLYCAAVSAMLAIALIARMLDDKPLLAYLDQKSDDLLLPIYIHDKLDVKKARKFA